MGRVYGVGINDMKTTKRSDIHEKAYISWKGMLRRCYSTKALQRRKTYNECSVCEEWHLFSNFYKWFIVKYRLGYSLDKDILVDGNKIYSPQTCCFVPKEINNMFSHNNRHGCDLPIGVSHTDRKKPYTTHILEFGKLKSLGRFYSKEDAFFAYKQAKEEHIRKIANLYRGAVDEEVYEALLKWEVKLTD